MTFKLHLPPFTDDVKTAPASFLEQLRTDINAAVDGTAGGTYAGAITWSGLHTYTDQIKLSGSAAGVQHRLSFLGDANTTLYVTYDMYLFNVKPSADRTYTLSHTGAPIPQIGNVIRIVMNIESNTNAAIFKREDATELGRINGNGNQGWIEFFYASANTWMACGVGGDGVITAH